MRGFGTLSRVVPDAVLARLLPASRTFDARSAPIVPEFPPGAARRVLIGSENSAGQGYEWARALERHGDRVRARAVAIDRGGAFAHDADLRLPAAEFAWSSRWQRAMRRLAAAELTHVLVESGRPVLAGGSRGHVVRDLRWFARHGIAAALVWHGSDIRDPDRHAAEHPLSPYRDAAWSSVAELTSTSRRNRRLALESGLPSFVSTPDLLLDVPGATWLPIVVDAARWSIPSPPAAGGGLLRVMHAPSRDVVKGSALVEPVLRELHDRGVIDYRRVEGVPHDRMPQELAKADVVLDQFRLGSYGVAAVEAMAAGRIVIGDVSAQVRSVVQAASGHPLPVIDARPDTLRSLLEGFARDPDEARALASTGPAFVAAVHDGRLSHTALAPWIADTSRTDGGG